jgi:hypothetical protein
MRLRRQIAWTLLLQGGGAAAGLASIALLGIYLGPAAQGAFSLIKIEVAFIGSLAIFGLTQSLFYHVQSARMNINRAKEIAFAMALVGGLSALVYGVFVQSWTGFDLIAFVFACVAYVWFGILRGVVLAAGTTRIFNFMSVMPQGLLLLYAILAVLIGHINNLDVALAFAASFGVSAICAIRWLTVVSLEPRPVTTEERLPIVFKFGLASGLAEVAASVSLLLAVKEVGSRFGVHELGVFTFAVMLAQGLLLPISYTVPLLFKRWMERPDALASMKSAVLVVVILGGLAFVIRYIISNIIPSTWLGDYSSISLFLWILFLATAFDGCQKILAVYANAQGTPWLSPTSEILRLIIVVSGLTFYPIQKVSDVAWIVCAAAMLSSGMLLLKHHNMK